MQKHYYLPNETLLFILTPHFLKQKGGVYDRQKRKATTQAIQ